MVADMLSAHGKPYVALDADADLIMKAKRAGYHAMFGDAARGTALTRLGIEHSPAIVLTMDEPILAKRPVKRLRQSYPDLLNVEVRMSVVYGQVWSVQLNQGGR